MILIRCDANPAIGAGHFFRELALAEAAADRGKRALLAMHRPAATFVAIAAASNVDVVAIDAKPSSVEDAEEVCRLATIWRSTAVVVDGYHFDTKYYESLNKEAFTLAAVDDIAHQRFPVQILVNANYHATELSYGSCRDTQFLLGLEYVLLRRQFRSARATLDIRKRPKTPQSVSRILVTMGGSDPTNETGKVLRALSATAYNGEVHVVIGPANPYLDELRATASNAASEITFHANVSNMADLMLGQHLAICAAGGTSWELAYLRVPMLQLIVADNQRANARWLAEQGVAQYAGWCGDLSAGDLAEVINSLRFDKPTRTAMIRNGQRLIDGRGAERFLDVLLGDGTQ